jgi:hypothetical protein
VNFILGHAEIVFQDAALPERGGLLILADTDAFTDEVFGLLDA